MASTDGAAIVHCAAGKDRTGVLCALALEVAGATREAIVADYVATAERIEASWRGLRASDTYRDDLDTRRPTTHRPRAEYIEQFLRVLDERFGGPMEWLASHGWSTADSRTPPRPPARLAVPGRARRALRGGPVPRSPGWACPRDRRFPRRVRPRGMSRDELARAG
ncbi:tyrosine-protein phosphatase [Streptosporangium vulgare]|uniref:tyrosine-protein phosphatase n=1 Tax=Streptosporangium vulgare TaxID=46190 RepID=UPI0031CE2B74